jgi:NAD(P)-dependent dehydrogenase (short-subunit alcohol dehydrogenase family)
MGSLALENLHVLITGVEASLSRDVVRQLALHGATVTAADLDVRRLSRLHRDVSLFRAKLETAPINLGSASELKSFEDHLRLVGRLPHMQVCCCPVPGRECIGALAGQVLQPSLMLHAEPLGRGLVGRTIASLKTPTLLSVLGREPGRGLFSPHEVTPRVRIASHTYTLRRQIDVAANDSSVRQFAQSRRRANARPADFQLGDANAA